MHFVGMCFEIVSKGIYLLSKQGASNQAHAGKGRDCGKSFTSFTLREREIDTRLNVCIETSSAWRLISWTDQPLNLFG